MTSLDRLIQAHVEGTVVTTVTTTIEKIAEEIAREWLKDPQFKQEVQALVRKHADATLAALHTNGRRTRSARKRR